VNRVFAALVAALCLFACSQEDGGGGGASVTTSSMATTTTGMTASDTGCGGACTFPPLDAGDSCDAAAIHCIDMPVGTECCSEGKIGYCIPAMPTPDGGVLGPLCYAPQ